jgi:predicted Rossmann fold nucleotide-binding protein DprA/Smf involved in DNA uptake
MKDPENQEKHVWKNSLKDYPENLAIIKNRPFYIFEVG